jgi:hypothetical protein
MQLPQMNPWPLPRSVLLMDNCAIHKMEALRIVVEAKSMVYVLFIDRMLTR